MRSSRSEEEDSEGIVALAAALATVAPKGKEREIVASPLRVCFIALSFAPDIGGAQSRTEKQARQLQALGHQVTILTTRRWRQWPGRETLNGLPVVRVGGIYRHGGGLRIGRLGIWPINLGVLWKLWKWRHHYDVIHVVQLSNLAAMAVLVGKYAGKPVIITIQSSEPSAAQRARLERECALMADTLTDTSFLELDPASWITGSNLIHMPRSALGSSALFKFIVNSNAIFQTLGTRNRSELIAHGFRSEQIVHISGSVDTKRFRPAPAHRLDPARSERVIACVARLDFAKGVDVLLHAWGRMMRAPASWREGVAPKLQLVGDGELRPQLERIVETLDIADSVEFLGERVDVVDLLQQAWGFVLPSRWEGMPNALLEAMACGLPCVATRVSGSEDIIADGVDGLLVEPEQPAELAQALRRVIQDARLAHRLGDKAREKVVRDYQLIHVAEQCVALYRRLLTHDGDALDLTIQSRGVGE